MVKEITHKQGEVNRIYSWHIKRDLEAYKDTTNHMCKKINGYIHANKFKF